MGHTVFPMRWIVYEKMQQLKKLCKALREPEKSIAEGLIFHIYQNISAISYANPLPNEIENNIIFSILFQEKKKNDSTHLDDLSLLIFSLMVIYKSNHSNNPDERREAMEKIMEHIDAEDVVFIAASLSQGEVPVWSDDAHFNHQHRIDIIKSEKIIN